MNTTHKLVITFEADNEKKVNLIIRNVKSSIEPTTIKAITTEVITNHQLDTEELGGSIVKCVEAVIVTTKETEYSVTE